MSANEANQRIQTVLSELTGRPAGLRVEHRDGRVDIVAQPEPTALTPEHLGMSMAELHRRSYDLLRGQGYSHSAAQLLMGVRHVRPRHS